MADFAIVYTMDGMHAEVGTFHSVEQAVAWWDSWVAERPEDSKRGCEIIQKRPMRSNAVVHTIEPD